MFSALILCSVAAAGITVDVQLVSGATTRGELVGIQGESAVVNVDGEPQTWELNRLWQITALAPEAPTALLPKAWVRLIDGSELCCRKYVVSSSTADMQLLSGETVKVNTRNIDSVRFRDHSTTPEFAEQWKELSQRKADGDMIIIRRSETLDHLDGMVRDVTTEVVQFEFEGQDIDVNRTKLDGIVYYHPVLGEFAKRLAEVVDSSGSRWNVRSLQTAEDGLQLVSVSGVKLTVPLARLVQIDFSSGNTVWLDDLKPEAEPYQPFFETRSFSASQLLEFYRKATKRLVVGGQVFSRGIPLFSRTEVTYRLNDSYRQFHAVAGLDDNAGGAGVVQLSILGDGTSLFEQTIRGEDDPVTLDLDITDVRRLKIIVDYGDGGDLGDQLDLCEARLTK